MTAAAPTADDLYEYTLDNLYAGESSGSTEAPTGWFARVYWPGDEEWYLVSHDDLGFSHILAMGKDEVDRHYAVLEEVYSTWDDQ